MSNIEIFWFFEFETTPTTRFVSTPISTAPVNRYQRVPGRWLFAPTISLLSSSTTQRYRIARTSTCWHQVSWLANRSYRIVWPESSGLIDVDSNDPRRHSLLLRDSEINPSFVNHFGYEVKFLTNTTSTHQRECTERASLQFLRFNARNNDKVKKKHARR